MSGKFIPLFLSMNNKNKAPDPDDITNKKIFFFFFFYYLKIFFGSESSISFQDDLSYL